VPFGNVSISNVQVRETCLKLELDIRVSTHNSTLAFQVACRLARAHPLCHQHKNSTELDFVNFSKPTHNRVTNSVRINKPALLISIKTRNQTNKTSCSGATEQRPMQLDRTRPDSLITQQTSPNYQTETSNVRSNARPHPAVPRLADALRTRRMQRQQQLFKRPRRHIHLLTPSSNVIIDLLLLLRRRRTAVDGDFDHPPAARLQPLVLPPQTRQQHLITVIE
jgi:hypothetical protein